MTSLSDLRIPYGAYWSTPFTRWQGTLSDLNSLKLAAATGAKVAKEKGWALETLDHAVLGITVPQEKSFWGAPWVMTMMGAPYVTGPTVSQACATSARALSAAAAEIAGGDATASLVVTCDRTSNSPVVVHPNPKGPSGAPIVENWMLDNFNDEPTGHFAMVDTAENCARDWQISTQEQHELTALRYDQYRDALKDDKAFLRRFMTLPFAVPDARFKKDVATLEGDEGIHDTTLAGLSRLKPVRDGGTVTFGSQTHPADGNAGMIVVAKDRVSEFTTEPGIEVRILGFGQARERHAYMPAAPVKAARRALDAAGIAVDRIDAFKSHNPFVVNDIVFSRETGVDVSKMNNFGCSLVFGHPQGPTGLRLMIELIEELAMRGGGTGLFHGCAAGDTAMAVVLSVTDKRA
ncbi:thiolase family protein [Pseudorhodoplanes sp.]|uniref:thiolase family protein n=1 Tax=Pseudorhodoplanes sp. TaxID=1934341 RepID=UPI002CB8E9F7|nr:thiolase family protein [Pseudorhodoplanes sp.]HWV51515.1 thiolase family protein [Pseudorhodoplanes sp.]